MKLPKSWKQITIEQFQEITLIQQDAELSALDRNIWTLSHLTGQPYGVIEALPFGQLTAMIKKTSFLNNLETMPKKVQNMFVMGWKVYRVYWEIDKQSAAQYVDISHFAKDPAKIIENLHNIMAVYCLPVFGKNYHGGDFYKRAELFRKNLTVDIAYPLAVFFCNLWLNLMPDLRDYLSRQLESMTMEELRHFQEKVNLNDLRISGVGC